MQDIETIQDFHNVPRVDLRAAVSGDGTRITIVLSQEFIDQSATVLADQHGRHRIKFDPTYGGKQVIGFVDPNGVKWGKLDVLAAQLDIFDLVPHKTSTWFGKQRETDILIGDLITRLRKDKETTRPALVEPAPIAAAPRYIEKPWTIEDALTFISKWAKDNDATLSIDDDGELIAEINKKFRAKK